MKLTTLILSLVTLVFLAGCQNTMQGLSKDVSNNATEIRKEINEN